MPGFLYFAPVPIAPTLAKAREWGLGYAFSKEPAPRQVQGETPSGAGGFIFADWKRIGESQLKLDMSQQTWRKIPGKDVWVGYWNDAKPGPADLARPDQLAGFNIKMADGNEWLIPVVRAFDEDTAKAIPLLPTLYGLDDNGQLTRGEIQAAHRWLWELTEPFWEAMVSEGEISDQGCLDAACKLIGANYAVDAIELAGLLQIFSPQLSPMGVVSLALDYGTFSQWAAKKKQKNQSSAEGTSDTPRGETAAPKGMRRHALTS